MVVVSPGCFALRAESHAASDAARDREIRQRGGLSVGIEAFGRKVALSWISVVVCGILAAVARRIRRLLWFRRFCVCRGLGHGLGWIQGWFKEFSGHDSA